MVADPKELISTRVCFSKDFLRSRARKRKQFYPQDSIEINLMLENVRSILPGPPQSQSLKSVLPINQHDYKFSSQAFIPPEPVFLTSTKGQQRVSLAS